MNITESRDEAFEAIAEMLRSNIKKTKIASKLAADYCVSDKTVYKWITRVEEMYDIEPIVHALRSKYECRDEESYSNGKYLSVSWLYELEGEEAVGYL